MAQPEVQNQLLVPSSNLFQCSGILRYSQIGGYRLIVEIDAQLGSYYRALLPKYFNVKSSRHPTHITVVRTGRDVPSNLSAWGLHEGERVQFFYEPGIHESKTYYWLQILSKRLEEIRTELGLVLDGSAYGKPPEPFIKYFHCTIGNKKKIDSV
jgi:hypothetical protein